MAFKTNTTATATNELIPEGEYEVIIRNAEEKQSYSGTNTKLNFSLVIRNDVEQKQKNRYLFLEIWKKHEPNADDKQVDSYNYAHLMSLVKAVGGIPDGTEFETVLDLCKVLVGKCMRVKVTHNTYNGRTSEKIDQLYGLMPTKFPDCKHVFQNKSAGSSEGFAQRPAESFVSQTGMPADSNAYNNDFEEILGEGDIPF
ncbi:MAG: DUF669 domain-containing protein [Ruminococcus sp.]|nr:DUF669 domain-containing protein [Ruminococcus sp.]